MKALFLTLLASTFLAQPVAAQSHAAGHHATGHHEGGHHAMESSPEAAKAPYDLQFLDTMISHHQGAVDMAKFIEGRTKNPTLLRIAADIEVSQKAEIDEMHGIRNAHFKDAKQAVNMDFAGMRESMEGMDNAALEKAEGVTFDKEFSRQMIPHHQGAVVMCEDAEKNSRLTEIKALCARIVPAQSKEIAEMKAVLAE